MMRIGNQPFARYEPPQASGGQVQTKTIPGGDRLPAPRLAPDRFESGPAPADPPAAKGLPEVGGGKGGGGGLDTLWDLIKQLFG